MEFSFLFTFTFAAPQPKVLKIGHDDVVSILEGKVLTLVCKAKGSPAPNIMWYKDNQPITARDGRVFVKSNNKGWALNCSEAMVYCWIHSFKAASFHVRNEQLTEMSNKWIIHVFNNRDVLIVPKHFVQHNHWATPEKYSWGHFVLKYFDFEVLSGFF